MPAVHERTCTACGHKDLLSGIAFVVTLDDGTEMHCGHPGEQAEAERATGVPFEQLVEQGRFTYRYPRVCGSCGELDYFELPKKRGLRGLFRKPEASAPALCANCGEAVTHDSGDWGSGRCPNCHEGGMTATWVGIS